MSTRNTTTTRRSSIVTRYRQNARKQTVYNPADHQDGIYENTHSTKRLEMAIRREDTRHGGVSEVVILANPREGNMRGEVISLSLSEARSLKAFLDRELKTKAR